MSKYAFFRQSYIQPRAAQTAGALLVSALHGLTVFLLPLSTGAFLELAQQNSTGKGAVLSMLGIHLQGAVSFFLFFSGALVLRFVLGWYEKMLTGKWAHAYAESLHRDLFYSYISNGIQPPQQQAFRYAGEMTGIRSLVEKGWHGGIKDVLMLAGGIALLLVVNVWLTICLLGTCLPLALAAFWLTRPVQQGRRLKNTAKKQLLQAMNRLLYNQSGKQPVAASMKKFKQKQDSLLQASHRYRMADAALRSFTQTAGYAALGAVLAFAWFTQRLHTGGLFVFILLALTLIPCIRRLLQLPAIWQRGIASLNGVQHSIESTIRHGSGSVLQNEPTDTAPAAL